MIQKHDESTSRIAKWTCGVIVVATLVALVVYFNFPARNPPIVDEPKYQNERVKAVKRLPLPPLSSSPFKNTNPDVNYISDKVCADCHQDIYNMYFSSSMGKSLFTLAEAPKIERYDKASNNPFTVDRYRYEVRLEGDRMFHSETHLDSKGNEILKEEYEVQYAVGSGVNARSYFVVRDGHYNESPITWYPRKNKWDISPGYEKGNQRFSRHIVQKCMYCHTNRFQAVEHSDNHYLSFDDGHAIGCQRCHGPGDLHVKFRLAEKEHEGVDYTIVNPAHLKPALRDSVCEQCHLSSEAIIPRRGRKVTDYRPGLPLHEFVSHFNFTAKYNSEIKFSSHANQMKVSRCFLASDGKMGCISCHTPHSQPKPAEKISFYRKRCLNCHQEESCVLALTQRHKTTKDDSCIVCHMPGGFVFEIDHTASTDHRIPRFADKDPSKSHVASDAKYPLIHSHRDLAAKNDVELERDMAIALMRLYKVLPEYSDPKFLNLAVPRLKTAVERDPNDLDARLALGVSMSLIGDRREALRQFSIVLQNHPKHELALYFVARNATFDEKAGNARAIEKWRKLIVVNPWVLDYHIGLATACNRALQWEQTEQAARSALKKFPRRTRLICILIESYLARGMADEAEREYKALIHSDPPFVEDFEKWYRLHPLRQ